MSKLLPPEIAATLPLLRSQEEVADPMVMVKFFHPLSHWAWYAIEFDPQEGIFFGWVYGDFPEYGYFFLAELEGMLDPLGIGIERDTQFTPRRMSEVKMFHSQNPLVSPIIILYLIEAEEQ